MDGWMGKYVLAGGAVGDAAGLEVADGERGGRGGASQNGGSGGDGELHGVGWWGVGDWSEREWFVVKSLVELLCVDGYSKIERVCVLAGHMSSLIYMGVRSRSTGEVGSGGSTRKPTRPPCEPLHPLVAFGRSRGTGCDVEASECPQCRCPFPRICAPACRLPSPPTPQGCDALGTWR